MSAGDGEGGVVDICIQLSPRSFHLLEFTLHLIPVGNQEDIVAGQLL